MSQITCNLPEVVIAGENLIGNVICTVTSVSSEIIKSLNIVVSGFEQCSIPGGDDSSTVYAKNVFFKVEIPFPTPVGGFVEGRYDYPFVVPLPGHLLSSFFFGKKNRMEKNYCEIAYTVEAILDKQALTTMNKMKSIFSKGLGMSEDLCFNFRVLGGSPSPRFYPGFKITPQKYPSNNCCFANGEILVGISMDKLGFYPNEEFPLYYVVQEGRKTRQPVSFTLTMTEAVSWFALDPTRSSSVKKERSEKRTVLQVRIDSKQFQDSFPIRPPNISDDVNMENACNALEAKQHKLLFRIPNDVRASVHSEMISVNHHLSIRVFPGGLTYAGNIDIYHLRPSSTLPIAAVAAIVPFTPQQQQGGQQMLIQDNLPLGAVSNGPPGGLQTNPYGYQIAPNQVW